MFERCNIEKISIPQSVEIIGDNPFAYCRQLSQIKIDINNPNYKVVNNCIYSKDGSELITYDPHSKETTFIIPDSVRVIKGYAFYGNCDLTNIILPEGLISIEGGAFSVTDINSLTITSGVQELSWGAFWACSELKTLIIESPKIANNISVIEDSYILILQYIGRVSTIYIKTGFDVSESNVLLNCFTKQATSDKNSYDMWVKNATNE